MSRSQWNIVTAPLSLKPRGFRRLSLPIHPSSFILHPSRRAFTLLEVIAATTMFSVLIGVVYGILYSSLRLRQNAYDAFEAD
ncbi:prepilin-type N-terminal cleavage/methylation domain-containing protein, partial [Candidatus Sumerlaeota bacterium]|nr:prepilin-type N-terminal cleavage/methylation domain-containing protein [Candidatus Sumerlaeota bacterium]